MSRKLKPQTRESTAKRMRQSRAGLRAVGGGAAVGVEAGGGLGVEAGLGDGGVTVLMPSTLEPVFS